MKNSLAGSLVSRGITVLVVCHVMRSERVSEGARPVHAVARGFQNLIFVFCGNKNFRVTASVCRVFKEFGEGSKGTFYIDQMETAPLLGLQRVTDICTVLAILFGALTMNSVTLEQPSTVCYWKNSLKYKYGERSIIYLPKQERRQ